MFASDQFSYPSFVKHWTYQLAYYPEALQDHQGSRLPRPSAVSLGDQQCLRHERRRTDGVAEWWQVEMSDGRVIPRTISVRHHPHVFSPVQVDRRDPPVGRLDERKLVLQVNEPAVRRAIAQIDTFRIS